MAFSSFFFPALYLITDFVRLPYFKHMLKNRPQYPCCYIFTKPVLLDLWTVKVESEEKGIEMRSAILILNYTSPLCA